MTATLRIASHEDRVVVTLDRPGVKNAIDLAMVAELHDVCAELERLPKILIIHGANNVFAAGADIAQLRDRRREDALSGINSGIFERIARLPLPTVAAVDGHALGGGAELAYACDFRLATSRARFGNPEPQLGIMAAAGACWRLRELVGEPLAKEVLLAGRVLTGDEAATAGLVGALHDPDDLLPAAHALVDRIAKADPLALRLTKLALHAPPTAHPTFDDVAQAVLFESPDKYRRMTDFLDRKVSR